MNPSIFLARPAEPAAGTRLAVKDLFDTAGLVTTYGSAIFRDNVPRVTAVAVTRLEQAGYANVGKVNLHEFAYGITSQNPHFGTVLNPAAPGRVAGGSSGGSAAALAAGLAEAALGTDTGGSIRIPSAWCGTTGFKPTYGLVSLEGCFPLAPSFDHAGPMARDVSGCVAMMRAMTGGFAGEPPGLSLGDLRVGVCWLELADPLVRRRMSEAAAELPGARPVRFPLPEGGVTQRVFMREVAEVHRQLFRGEGARYGENVATKLRHCLAVGDEEYQRGLDARAEYRERAFESIEGIDLLLTPTVGFVAPPLDVDELAVRERATRLTFPFNLLGWPALALPCGPAEDGLPCSVQLVGRPRQDALVLEAGRLLERQLGLAGGRSRLSTSSGSV